MSHRATVIGPVKGKYKAECRDCEALINSKWTNLDRAFNEAARHRDNT